MLFLGLDLKIKGVILGVFVIAMLGLIQSEHFLLSKTVDGFIENRLRGGEARIQGIFRKKVVYIINKGDGYISEHQITPYQDSTVFSLLKNLAQKKGFDIESTVYKEMGVFVESIDGIENGSQGKYWQYWVNDELPMKAADKIRIQGDDIVEWKFEEPLF